MAELLGNKLVSEDIQEKNNSKNNYFIVFGVLFFVFIYSYLFTQIYQWLHIPSPEYLFNNIPIIKDILLFDDDTNLDSLLGMSLSGNVYFGNDNERLIFFGILSITFLTSYFSNIKYKKYSIVIGTLSILLSIFHWKQVFLFLIMHLSLYLSFHFKNSKSDIVSYFLGFFILIPFINIDKISYIHFIYPFLSGIGLYYFYKLVLLKLFEKKAFVELFRTIIVQIAMISIIISLFFNYTHQFIWNVPVGLFLFFIQWQRIILYHIDFKDKVIPNDLSLINYLIVFFNPSVTLNCVDGHVIGSGYKYITNNFLSKDKNEVVLSGIKILNIALLYLLIWNWVPKFLVSFIENNFSIIVYSRVENLISAHLNGDYISTPTVLLSTLIHQIRWFILFGGIVHFKVGIWRILGFNLAPYFDKPWLATNLISLWARYSFYFREFLVKSFYYPVFLNYFKKKKNLRIFMATFAASCFGNYTWGHLPEIMLLNGLETKNLVYILPRWPYYLLLGLGISLTQIYLLKKKSKRKPWTKDKKIILDFLFAYLTIQFFSLIHVFARPVPEGSIWDYTKLFLIGIGIHL